MVHLERPYSMTRSTRSAQTLAFNIVILWYCTVLRYETLLSAISGTFHEMLYKIHGQQWVNLIVYLQILKLYGNI